MSNNVNEKFINDSYELEADKDTARKVLEFQKGMELLYNKHLYEFSREEIMETLNAIPSSNLDTTKVMLEVLTKYFDWAILTGLIPNAVNLFRSCLKFNVEQEIGAWHKIAEYCECILPSSNDEPSAKRITMKKEVIECGHKDALEMNNRTVSSMVESTTFGKLHYKELDKLTLKKVIQLEEIQKGIKDNLLKTDELVKETVRIMLDSRKSNEITVTFNNGSRLANSLYHDSNKNRYLFESRLFEKDGAMKNAYLMLLDSNGDLLKEHVDDVWEIAEWNLVK